MDKQTGGPAFPGPFVKHAPGEVGNNVAIYEHSEGLTLRDYFAAKAMAAFSADAKRGPDTLYMNYESAAREAYSIADAMILERAK